MRTENQELLASSGPLAVVLQDELLRLQTRRNALQEGAKQGPREIAAEDLHALGEKISVLEQGILAAEHKR